jgi:hypothetical protein
MKKRYKIVVTEYSDETRTRGNQWQKGAGEKTSDNEGAYGYTPEIEVTEEIERQVYVQNTDSLDLKKVIMAINGILPVN